MKVCLILSYNLRELRYNVSSYAYCFMSIFYTSIKIFKLFMQHVGTREVFKSSCKKYY